ncbi:Peptidase C48 [Macleaya cordata]|uniref:Peptidase C48 n=1 Tax=Macleaya cordata TaxID=56857 RepID=A0A200QWU8_MACCD|nr:Peptidase C48 [Macleaya cordata]
MGALTINRKRGNDFLSLNSFSSPCYSPGSSSGTDLQVSKKPRVSFMQNSQDKPVDPVQKHNTVSRVLRYPEPTRRFVREVHAPCRKPRFSLSSNLVRETRTHEMGNFLSRQLEQAKSFALESFQHSGNAKAKRSKDVISDDSSVEELEILEDGIEVEGRSVISEQRSLENSGDKYLQEKYANFANNNFGATSSLASDLAKQKPKVDETGKMLETLSVNREVEDMGVPPHKRMYESAERRNSKLGSLAFEIALLSKKLSFFSRPSKKPEEDVLGELFTPLTEEEKAEVDLALSYSKRRKVLVAHENSNIEITGEMLQCLTPGAWLNDEVINVYLELLKEREKREPKKFLKCHFFNTFFYKKLIGGRVGYDFKAVKRWTTQRKLGYGLIECDKIFVPIHKEIHWCLAVINKKEQKFQYLDSLRGIDSQVLKVLARYFMEEVKDKSSKDIDISSWKHEYVEDLPEQENGWDCGMFMIKYADFYSRGLGLCFNQEHMPYFRRRTAKEILRLKAE